MGRIIRSSVNNIKSLSPSNKILLEANSPLGRQSLSLDLACVHESNNQKRIKNFLEANGYSTPVDKFISLIKSHRKSHSESAIIRLERLGLKPDKTYNYPGIGQSHELEFGYLRAKLADQATISHAVDLFEVSNKLNGVSALKVVSETLGKTKENATTEVVLGPSGTKEEYNNILLLVDKFRSSVSAREQSKAQTIGDLFSALDFGGEKIIPKSTNTGLVWNLDPNNIHSPNVHTSRGAPIRAMSSMLLAKDSGLLAAPRKLLEYAIKRTDEYIGEAKIQAPHGGKLWEAINLSIWMSACEGVVQPLMHDDIEKTYAHNKILASWVLYAGKNFFGTLPRFSAGDLIRSGGLKGQDEQQLHELFASDDVQKNKNNKYQITLTALRVVEDFLVYLDENWGANGQEIVKILKEYWHQVEFWVRRDLTSDFVPYANKRRYPNDTPRNYGNKINTQETSPSFASSQYIPRREVLEIKDQNKAPVSGVFELRGDVTPNQKMAEHFSSKEIKRKADALDSAWENFENYVGRFAKKPRV